MGVEGPLEGAWRASCPERPLKREQHRQRKETAKLSYKDRPRFLDELD